MTQPACPACRGPLEAGAHATLLTCARCRATFVPAGARQVSLLTHLGEGPAADVASINLTPEFTARFALGQLLGAGAMGTVYRASELATGRQVAIKFLTRIDDPALLARFLNEGRLLASVRHPNVIELYEVQALDGFPYLVTEYVEGGTVRSLLDHYQTLTLERSAHIMVQVLDGLQEFHSRGIVHRDLKPENVLITTRGGVRLADLGIAKKYGDQRDLAPDDAPAKPVPARAAATMAGTLIGTPRYMAPEQVRGEPAVVATDLHAAGAMLYEMLCGHPPFEGGTLSELLYQIEHTVPMELAHRVLNLPSPISVLVSRALGKRLAERPASAADMATLLRKFLHRPLGPLDMEGSLRFGAEDLARVIKMRDKVRPADFLITPRRPSTSLAMPPVSMQNLDRVATARPPAPPPPPAPSPFAPPSRDRVTAPPPAAPADPTEERALRQAAAREPQFARVHLALGQYLEAAARLLEAEACYRAAIQREPRNGTAQVHLGLLLARLGQPDKAEQRLRAAIACEPDSGWLHQSLGDFLAARNRPQAAATAYRAGLALDPESPALLYRVIITLRDLDPPAARAALTTVLRSDPQNGWARRQLDELTSTRPPATLADYRAIASTYRASGAAQFDLARALERAELLSEARAAYQAASADPAYAWAAYDLERLDREP